MTNTPAAHSGTFLLGGERPVHRLGFGAMLERIELYQLRARRSI